MKERKKKRLVLKDRAAVFIDWANVYGWTKSLGREVNTKTLFMYLKTYPEIEDIRLYFGRDAHPKSEAFLAHAAHTGYSVIEKPVKYIPVATVGEKKVLRRKCDFDMEVCIDVHRLLGEDIASFVFFTGDGDYAPLYEMLIGRGKQVIVVYTAGHLGKEVWSILKGLFKVQLKNLRGL